MPAPAEAQTQNLPRLGDAAGSELTPGSERRVGEAIMGNLRRDGAVLEDPELTEYLNRFGGRLARTSPARAFSFEFFLVRDESLNAFALPGGYIGVHSGLIVTARTESELASVLAHEIGHVTQRHVARMLAQNQQSSMLALAAVAAALLTATTNPQAAAGLVALGGSVQESQMLSFSRDAEREADRVGLDIMLEAGFIPADMITFFGRLQQATQVYDTGAPSYLRTHPLTSDRMADVQNRVLELRYRQRTDSVDFHLARTKLRALANASTDYRDRVRREFEGEIARRAHADASAAWYGLALLANAADDFDAARAALGKARDAMQRDHGSAHHPFLERLDAEIAQRGGRLEDAMATIESALQRFADARALRLMKAELLVASGRHARAVGFIEDELQVYRGDAEYWRLLAAAQSQAGNEGLAHWATGERYASLGAWPAALEQFERAQRDSRLSFYELAQIDARVQHARAAIEREKQGL